MCGLVAALSRYSSGLVDSELDVFEQMLYADAVRGWDSTGVVGVNKFGNGQWFKTVGSPLYLMMEKDYTDWYSKLKNKSMAVLGHNRKATVGKVGDDTAHPFTEGTITVMHNGHIRNWKDIEPSVTVDSHSIAHLLNRESYKTALAKLDGAFALIWYDSKDRCVRFCRNSERPLSIATLYGTYYVASEKDMLTWIVNRSPGQKITELKSIDIGDVYTFDVTTGKLTVEKEVFKKANFPHTPTVVSGTVGVPTSRANRRSVHPSNGVYGEGVYFLVESVSAQPSPGGDMDYCVRGTQLDSPNLDVVVYCMEEDTLDIGVGDICRGQLNFYSSTKDGKFIRLQDRSIFSLDDDESVVFNPDPDPAPEPKSANKVTKAKSKVTPPKQLRQMWITLNGEEISNNTWPRLPKKCNDNSCRRRIRKDDLEYCIVDISHPIRVWCPSCSSQLMSKAKVQTGTTH